MNLHTGPAYTLDCGSRLRDVRVRCWHCGKKLAEVLFDATYTWRPGDFVCLDCGTAHAPVKVLAS